MACKINDAVVIFSASVSRLKKCNGNGNGFADAHLATELARLHADHARNMLILHRGEHGC
jgi:hypothetical protein